MISLKNKPNTKPIQTQFWTKNQGGKANSNPNKPNFIILLTFPFLYPGYNLKMQNWTIQKLLNWVTQYLTDKGIDSPRLSAQLLISNVVGLKRIELYTQFDRSVPQEQLNHLRDLVKRAGQNEPVAYLVGRTEFYSLEITVTPDCMIPRPETELLVERAIEFLRERRTCTQFVCDLCTGSGCIAIAIAKNFSDAKIIATDICDAALAVAAENVQKHQLNDRITLLCGDLFDPIISGLDVNEFDLIVCNPPYVSTAEYEKQEQIRLQLLRENRRAYLETPILTEWLLEYHEYQKRKNGVANILRSYKFVEHDPIRIPFIAKEVWDAHGNLDELKEILCEKDTILIHNEELDPEFEIDYDLISDQTSTDRRIWDAPTLYLHNVVGSAKDCNLRFEVGTCRYHQVATSMINLENETIEGVKTYSSTRESKEGADPASFENCPIREKHFLKLDDIEHNLIAG